MKIVAFGASSSTQSINKQLASHAADIVKKEFVTGADIEVLDLNDFEMPIYSADRENLNGIPDQAKSFFKKLGTADALIISFAEHNGSYSAAYKNIFDWASRIDSKVFQKKPVLLLATSPGKGGANSVLKEAITSAPHFDGDVRAHLSIPAFHSVFDVEKGGLKDSEWAERLRVAASQLVS